MTVIILTQTAIHVFLSVLHFSLNMDTRNTPSLSLCRIPCRILCRTRLVVLAFAAVCGFAACSSTPAPTNKADSFDRAVFLRAMATNLIVPSYRETQSRVGVLQSAVQQFTQAPSEQSLQAAQTAWINAYKAWLRSAPFDFGPAESTFGTLRENIAVFPTNPRLTEQFITDGKSDLNNFNRDTRGLHGIEYLLFARPASETVSGFAGTSSGANSGAIAANRRQYLLAITKDVQTRVDATANRWLGSAGSSGSGSGSGSTSYVEDFVRNNGTSIGTSTSMLFNEFVKSFEELKNFKITVPFGLRAGQTTPAPQSLEGVYSQRSLEFMAIHLQVIEEIWSGKIITTNGTPQDFAGFEEYLASVAGGTALIADTKTQLTALKSALNAVPASPTLAELIATSVGKHPSLIALSTDVQKMTRFFKSDMSSLLGISITFSSGDGD
jgi:uncharacterized protein